MIIVMQIILMGTLRITVLYWHPLFPLLFIFLVQIKLPQTLISPLYIYQEPT